MGDEEVMAANLGKSSGTWQSGSRKTPTRTSPKEQSGKLESIYGRKTPTFDGRKTPTMENRKTPTLDSSPKGSTLSKEDIIFGRKPSPIDGKKSPKDGKKSPLDGSLRGKLPGVDDRPWQPPNFRSASPGSSEHSRGSRGVTPVDATLDTISETPREKMTPRMERGGKRTDIS